MTCPFCEVEAPVRELHAHLGTDHATEIRTEELGERTVYVVTCPYCSDQYRQPIRKGAADPGFLVEFERQIRLVAFDMLINHVLAEHGAERVEQ